MYNHILIFRLALVGFMSFCLDIQFLFIICVRILLREGEDLMQLKLNNDFEMNTYLVLSALSYYTLETKVVYTIHCCH